VADVLSGFVSIPFIVGFLRKKHDEKATESVC